MDLDSVISQLDPIPREDVKKALQVLVEGGIFPSLVRANMNRLVEGRVDSDSEDALIKEVRDIRQTNRALLMLEESAKQIVKGMNDEQ